MQGLRWKLTHEDIVVAFLRLRAQTIFTVVHVQHLFDTMKGKNRPGAATNNLLLAHEILAAFVGLGIVDQGHATCDDDEVSIS